MVEVLKGLPSVAHPWIIGDEVGPLDDAALLHPSGAAALVYTLDVITPIVDDARAFGRIAAANALSDIYAMGGAPQVALSFAGMPPSLGLDVLHDVLHGIAEKAAEGGCAIVGGHTIKDSEPKCGLAVIGTVEPARAWTHRRARAGQALVLTKAIGTGVIGQALRAADVEEEHVAAATATMELLNRAARDAGARHGVTAATDVTGFGLLGHLSHITRASGVEARLFVERVPLLEGARAAAARGHIPGGSRRNQSYVRDLLEGAGAVDELTTTLLCDAQTSGGLLLCLEREGAEALCRELGGAVVVGELVAGTPGRIQLLSSSP